jgi:hypothetical protein
LFVAGTAVFESRDYAATLQRLQSLAVQHTRA